MTAGKDCDESPPWLTRNLPPTLKSFGRLIISIGVDCISKSNPIVVRLVKFRTMRFEHEENSTACERASAVKGENVRVRRAASYVHNYLRNLWRLR